MKTARHVMVDIETMDSGPEAAIIGIGARVFTIEGPGKGFEIFIDPAKAALLGTVSTDTMNWWNRQPTRDLAFGGKADPADAFHSFAQFCKEQQAELVWANAPSFDCVILRHLAKQVAQQFPFHYRDERDCRTLFAIGRAANIDCEDLWTNPARRAHIALDDATKQAEVAIRIMRQLLSIQGVRSDPDSGLPRSVPEGFAGSTDGIAADHLPSPAPLGSSG